MPPRGPKLRSDNPPTFPRPASAKTIPIYPDKIGVRCPRCTTEIQCALMSSPQPPKPGETTAAIKLTIPDLADRMAEHYANAHTDLQTDRARNLAAIYELSRQVAVATPIPRTLDA